MNCPEIRVIVKLHGGQDSTQEVVGATIYRKLLPYSGIFFLLVVFKLKTLSLFFRALNFRSLAELDKVSPPQLLRIQ